MYVYSGPHNQNCQYYVISLNWKKWHSIIFINFQICLGLQEGGGPIFVTCLGPQLTLIRPWE